MKPILFAKNETDFTTNGIGRLDCISCKVVEERNGMYELEAEIPITGAHAKEIEMHSIIGVIPHEGSNIQAFYVYKIGKPISGRFRVYGRHISYRLTDIPCMPFSIAMSPQAATQTLAGLKSNAVEACPFNFYTDITTPASYTQKTPASIRQRLGGVEGSVIDLFGGEFEWDNWNVRLLKARGRLANVTGISLRYGKNITDLDQEEEIANTVTGVVPFWVDTDGNNLVSLPEHAVYAPNAGSYPYHLTQVLDLSSEFQDKPTVAQLRNTATLYVNKSGFGVPKVSIKVSFVDLWKSEEYKDIAPLEQVRLCDEITVDFEKLGVKAIAKVVKTTYDVLKERYTQIEVGSIRTTLAQAITDRDKDIDSVYLDVMSRVTQAAQNATAWLTSANGYVVAVKNTDGSWKEILFMDSNDPATARNCLRINNNGLGFWSHDRYPGGSALDGPYDNAWTIDGNLIADFITTGDLKSQNYEAPTQATSPYAVSGMDLALNNGNITSEYFVLTQLGAFLKGTIEASGGKIGAAEITPYSIVIRGDIELYTGTETFTFRPTDYYFVDDFVLTLTTEEGTTSSVTLVKHEDGSDTTIGTYTATDEGVTTAYIDHTIGTEEEDYYQLTISGSPTQVLADDVILAYMGQEGFRGTLRGIFRGYLESNIGIINGLRYWSGDEGWFNGKRLGISNPETHGHTVISPGGDIRRTYRSGNEEISNDVVWENELGDYATKENIEYHRNIGIGTGEPADPSGDLLPADGTVFFKHNGHNIIKIYTSVNGQFLENLSSNIDYGTNAPTGGENGDVYIENNGNTLTKIWQKVGGSWLFFERSGGVLTLPRVRISTIVELTNSGKYITNLSAGEIFNPQYEKRNGASYLSNMAVIDPLEGGGLPFKVSVRFYLNNLLNKWTGIVGGAQIPTASSTTQYRGLPHLQITDGNNLYADIHFANTDNASDVLFLATTTTLQASKWYRGEIEWTGKTDQKFYLRLYDADDNLLEEKVGAAEKNYYSQLGGVFQFGGSNGIGAYGLSYGTIDISNTYWTVDGAIKWGLDERNHEGGAQRIPTSEVATPIMVTNSYPYGTVNASAFWNGSEPWGAFRQSTTSYNWGCSQGAGAWISFKFDSQIVIKKVETWAATWATSPVGRDATKQFKFQGSNDYTNWTDLATCNCQTVTSENESRHNIFNIPNNVPYLYYRLYITQVQTNDQTAFACINLYE